MKFMKQIALMLVFMLATLSLFGCAKEPDRPKLSLTPLPAL